MINILKNKQRILLSFILIIFVFYFFSFVSGVFASSAVCGETVSTPLKFTFNVPLPGYLTNGGNSMEIDCMTLGNYIKYIYKFIIGTTGLLAVFMITLGSLKWIFSGGSSAAVSQAKQYISGSIAGILIALCSYSILYIINPQLVEVRPIIIPMAKKAMMATCPDTGKKSGEDKRTYVNIKDESADQTSWGTWCGLQYKIKGENDGPLCYGLSCGEKEVCTPFINNNPLNAKNAGKYDKYGCYAVDKAKTSTIGACNDTNDTTTGNAKAQEETQAACDDINITLQSFPVGTFSKTDGDKCMWLNYDWLDLKVGSNQDGCRWCPSSYYTKLKAKIAENTIKCSQLSNPNKDPDQPNGLCTKEEGCNDPFTDNGGNNNHEYAIDSCISILYGQVCNK